MLQLIKVGQYQMYRTVETETRAWVDNPLFKIEPERAGLHSVRSPSTQTARANPIVRDVEASATSGNSARGFPHSR
jgi:hypothetical protein